MTNLVPVKSAFEVNVDSYTYFFIVFKLKIELYYTFRIIFNRYSIEKNPFVWKERYVCWKEIGIFFHRKIPFFILGFKLFLKKAV